MTESKLYPVSAAVEKSAHIDANLYKAMYQHSIDKPEEFWGEKAEEFLTWEKKWSKVSDCDFSSAEIKWFVDGKLNVTVNCIDRHLNERGDQTAIIWEVIKVKKIATGLSIL